MAWWGYSREELLTSLAQGGSHPSTMIRNGGQGRSACAGFQGQIQVQREEGRALRMSVNCSSLVMNSTRRDVLSSSHRRLCSRIQICIQQGVSRKGVERGGHTGGHQAKPNQAAATAAPRTGADGSRAGGGMQLAPRGGGDPVDGEGRSKGQQC